MYNICYLLIVVPAVLFSITAQNWCDRMSGVPALPDVLHRSTRWVSYYWLNDWAVYIQIGLVCNLFYVDGSTMRTYGCLYSLLLVLRSISFNLTLLPKCSLLTRKQNYERGAWHVLRDYVMLRDRHMGHENDLLPSGHALFMVLVSLMSTDHDLYCAVVSWTLTVASSMLLVLSRCHYTIDVVYAYVLTLLVWQNRTLFV